MIQHVHRKYDGRSATTHFHLMQRVRVEYETAATSTDHRHDLTA